MAEKQCRVIVVVKGDHEIKGPWCDEQKAQEDLNAIRAAQKSSVAAMTELPWLSVYGNQIIAAHVVESASIKVA